MQRIICLTSVLAVTMLWSGCTPALYIRLFNATGELITVSNTQSDHGIAIAPGTAADLSMYMYNLHERLFIRGSNRLWSYSMLDFYQPRWPLALWQQHMGVMRTYGRVDSRGCIYILAPPTDGGQPHEIPQPNGFPIRPQKT